jgi:hypothetical protein
MLLGLSCERIVGLNQRGPGRTRPGCTITVRAFERWRCRESNPGPKQTNAHIYKLSCWLEFADPSGSSHRPRTQLAEDLMLVYRRLRAASCGCDDAPHCRRNPVGAPWSPFGDQFVPYPCLRSQRASAGAGEGEGERLASFGSCLFAPDLRGRSTSACSIHPICPVETSHPHYSVTIPQNLKWRQIGTRALTATHVPTP